MPIEEVDHWVDLDPDLAAHLMTGGAHASAVAQMAAFSPARVGVIIAGMEVPHATSTSCPIDREADLSFENADQNAEPEDLDAAADRLRDGAASR